jgi:hypothetical protein
MYDHSSLLIVGVLLLALLFAIEGGYRLGNRSVVNDSSKAQIGTIQSSLLGILALLLAFTFSLSLQRYESRSEAVVNEANAIGTAMLRADLLPPQVRDAARDALRQYLDLRVRASEISLDRTEDRAALVEQSDRLLGLLWGYARQAVDDDDSPVKAGLFVQSLNEVIDSYGTRDAALNRHVPELVLFLLFGTFVLTASLVGYSSGVAGHRASFATYVLVLLIAVLVFIIIDLDRPRRGLIEVSQQSLIDLQTAAESANGR